MSDRAMSPSLADQIRSFVYQRCVLPARAQGRADVEVRAGDVHHDMRLVGRMPAVCSALGAKFERDYGVQLLDRTGPPQGSNVFFRFRVDSSTVESRTGPRSHGPVMRVEPSAKNRQSEYRTGSAAPILDGTVALVSCVAEKRASPAPARDLYISDWFVKARSYVEHIGVPWFILSAEYGLVPPDQVIDPYERTLNTMPVDERRSWATRVIAQMSERMPGVSHVMFLAGARYREFLVDHFQRHGITVEIPMEGLRIGEQLSWLGRV
jgi:hypothetical protein